MFTYMHTLYIVMIKEIPIIIYELYIGSIYVTRKYLPTAVKRSPNFTLLEKLKVRLPLFNFLETNTTQFPGTRTSQLMRRILKL